MTEIHQLLLRLAELMLQNEQHFLSVDLLFDDELIGDFVKSIQIDSPYQQMLLEGVLTESIRDEKLIVSYTVEGYFHFILGEVIQVKTEGMGAEVLKEIVENNKLNGAKEGVEQCLIRDVTTSNLNRLLSLIDYGGSVLDYCTMPLTNLLLYDFVKNINCIDEKLYEEYIRNTLLKIFDKPTENDFIVLFSSLNKLEQLQKNNNIKFIYKVISEFENYDSINYISIIVKSIPHIDQKLKIETLSKIESSISCLKDLEIYPEILFEIGTQYLILFDFDKSIILYNKSHEIFSSRNGDFEASIEKLYSNLGAIYFYKQNIEKAQFYFELSHEICSDLYGLHHPSTAGAIHNLALVKTLENKNDESLELFNDSLSITLNFHGSNHPLTARLYSNIGSVYLRKLEYRKAYIFFKKAMDIDIQNYHINHHCLALNYDDIGDVYFGDGDMILARVNYNKSKSIFIYNYGQDYPSVKSLEEKILKTYDF
jgi:tetratricopeptide (TPR) repeat protein